MLPRTAAVHWGKAVRLWREGGKENYTSQQPAGRPWKGRVHCHVDSGGSRVDRLSCHQQSQRASGKGKRRGQSWPPLAAPLLHFTGPTSSKLQAWVSVRLREPLCSSDFLLLPERHQREQRREGRDESRAAESSNYTPPPPCLQILYLARKLSSRDSAGGERCPTTLEELL